MQKFKSKLVFFFNRNDQYKIQNSVKICFGIFLKDDKNAGHTILYNRIEKVPFSLLNQ